MQLKMRDLVAKTDTPKSTILYYIQEGLLPEPKKVKPNVHLYDERFVNMINFIKYLQKNFDASIGQIRDIVQSEDFDFSKGYENLIDNLNILMFASKKRVFSKEELASEANLSVDEVEKFIEMGVILDREGGFIDADLESLKIAHSLLELKGGRELLEEYLKCANILSKIESRLAIDSLSKSQDKNETSKLLLDTALILKPYIFDSILFKSFQQKRGEGDEKHSKD